jgi:hypothetical protein
MTERIAIIILVATFFYVIVPLASGQAAISREKRVLLRLKTAKGIFGVCSSWHNETLTVDPVAAAKAGKEKTDGLPFTVAPARTRFYVLEKEGTLERTSWNTVTLIKRGVTLMYFPGRTRHSRGICVFHEETSEKPLRERFAALAASAANGGTDALRAKYFSVAIGAFIEFLLFIESIGDESARIVSVAALLGIFGKALPWCPPGLAFTLASLYASGKRDPQKKNRRLTAAGFALSLAGVALNVGIILFVIVRLGIG